MEAAFVGGHENGGASHSCEERHDSEAAVQDAMEDADGEDTPTLSHPGTFIAAGVLPYCIDQAGNIKFFLGKELEKGSTVSGKSKYSWSDFGGKRENELETCQETACREFSEETLGLWGGMGPLQERIKQSIRNIKGRIDRACSVGGGDEGGGGGAQSEEEKSRVFVLKNGLYINFVLRLSYIDPLLFQLARDENDLLLAGELPDSDICRAAEKRDWAWVDSRVLLSCVEGGICNVVDEAGQRIHLLPRLAVSLRSHLRLMLEHIHCVEQRCSACASLLVVPMQQECRCLHLFDVSALLSSDAIRAAFGEGSAIERVTIYRDRNGKSNVFVLFNTGLAAVSAKTRALGRSMDESLWGMKAEEGGAGAGEGGGAAAGAGEGASARPAGGGGGGESKEEKEGGKASDRAQFAWFEYGVRRYA